MPTGSRKWISLPTHEKALVCHTVQRLRGPTTPEPVAEIERLREALQWIRDHAIKLRKGTDDWFELVEIEAMATQALKDTTHD